MRDEYITLIKQYITEKPDYLDSLHRLKIDLLAVGATNEEFDEALRQIDVPPHIIESLLDADTKPADTSGLKKKQLLTRLLEIDIIGQTIVMIGLVVFGILYFFSPPITNSINKLQTIFSKPSVVNDIAAVQSTIAKAKIPKQVYASGTKVNSQEIFSISPSDITLSISGKPKREVYGFFPYWMLDVADKIPINGLTTISFFGIDVDGKGNIVKTDGDGESRGGWDMWNDPKLDKFITKAKRRGIRLELTLKNFNNTNIEKLVLSDEAHKTFIANAVYLLHLKALDGINIDFEYVGVPSEKVRDGFTRLMINLREELKKQVPDATLTVDSYVTSAAIPQLIDIHRVAEVVDFFVIMGYDFHTPSGSAGPVAPMDGQSSITGYMQSYLEKTTPDKLVLAFAYYGYDWDVSGETDAKAIPYAQIANATKNTKLLWDNVAQSPYYTYIDVETKANRIVHFENTRSLGIKYDFVNKKDFKGVGIWALGYDGLISDLQSLLVEKFAK